MHFMEKIVKIYAANPGTTIGITYFIPSTIFTSRYGMLSKLAL